MNDLERLDICPRMRTGSCALCAEMGRLVSEVSFEARPVGPVLAELKNNVCPDGEKPVVPALDMKKQSSARFRLRGR